jgi:hypothetical protein
VVRISDNYRVIASPGVDFYRGMNFGYPLACGVEKIRSLLMKLLAAAGRNSVRADHHLFACAALYPAFVDNPFFRKHRKHLRVMDERTESTDILSLLTLLDGVHGHFDSAADPFAKAGCLSDYNFHCFSSIEV